MPHVKRKLAKVFHLSCGCGFTIILPYLTDVTRRAIVGYQVKDYMLFQIPECGYTLNTGIIDINGQTVAAVNNFIIYDESKRGTGWGSTIYQKWEKSIPLHVNTVYLRAINESAESFWRKMGFERLYTEPDLCLYENGGIGMSKQLHR